MMNLHPGSGVHWGEADEFVSWMERNPSPLAQEALADYGARVETMRKAKGSYALSATEHSEAFTAALATQGLKSPDCAVLMAYYARRNVYEVRMWDLHPLCEAYADRVESLSAMDGEAADHDRIFKDAIQEWRSKQQRSAEAIALVDSLGGMPVAERGKSIRHAIQNYMTAPGSFNRCTRLVWDAEKAAGLPPSLIR